MSGCAKGFCYWVTSVVVCGKITIVICEIISLCVFLFVRLSRFSYWFICFIIHSRMFWNNGWFDCSVVCEKGVFFFIWCCDCWANKRDTLLCCCMYCFKYFFVHKVQWGLNILFCQVSSTIRSFL